MKSKNRWICIWLAVIAGILFCGLVLFAAYVYKFNLLSPISEIFHADASVVWTALNAIATVVIGIAAFVINKKLESLQEKQVVIVTEQHRLLTEPHILVDNIEKCKAEMELSADGRYLKALKDIDYPYYSNIYEEDALTNVVLITVSIINTSEAFARVRFNEASFKDCQGNFIANYNGTTFGVHKNHLMIKKGETGKIGLLLRNDLLSELQGTKFTISTFLDNNFNECFNDIQHYELSFLCDEKVSFRPCTIEDNSFRKIEKEIKKNVFKCQRKFDIKQFSIGNQRRRNCE